ELKNIEHPIRLYRVVGRNTVRTATPAPAAEHVQGPGTSMPPPRCAWREALLHPSSLAPLLIGAYLLATRLGLPPTGRLFPAYGAVLMGVGLGRVLRLGTGGPASFLVTLGAGLVLAAVAGDWRHGPPL